MSVSTETISWAQEALDAGLRNRDGSVIIKTFDTKVDHRDDSQAKKRDFISWNFDRSVMFYGKAKKQYRQLPGTIDSYYISKDGFVRNLYGAIIRSRGTHETNQVRLRVGRTTRYFYRHELVDSVWVEHAPTMKGEYLILENVRYKTIPSFPDYMMGTNGKVIRKKNQTFMTLKGVRYYLSHKGKQVSRSVNVLYLETHGRVLGYSVRDGAL